MAFDDNSKHTQTAQPYKLELKHPGGGEEIHHYRCRGHAAGRWVFWAPAGSSGVATVMVGPSEEADDGAFTEIDSLNTVAGSRVEIQAASMPDGEVCRVKLTCDVAGAKIEGGSSE